MATNVIVTSGGLSHAISAGSPGFNGPAFPIKYFLLVYDERLDKTIHSVNAGLITDVLEFTATATSADNSAIQTGGHLIFNKAGYTISNTEFLISGGGVEAITPGIGSDTLTGSTKNDLTVVNLFQGNPLLTVISAGDADPFTTSPGTWLLDQPYTIISGTSATDSFLTDKANYFEIASFSPIGSGSAPGGATLRGLFKARLEPNVGDFKFNKIALFEAEFKNGVEQNSQPTLIAMASLQDPVSKTVSGTGNLSTVEMDMEVEFNVDGNFEAIAYKTQDYWTQVPMISGNAFGLFFNGTVAIGASGQPTDWLSKGQLQVSAPDKPQLRLGFGIDKYAEFEVDSTGSISISAENTHIDARINVILSAGNTVEVSSTSGSNFHNKIVLEDLLKDPSIRLKDDTKVLTIQGKDEDVADSLTPHISVFGSSNPSFTGLLLNGAFGDEKNGIRMTINGVDMLHLTSQTSEPNFLLGNANVFSANTATIKGINRTGDRPSYELKLLGGNAYLGAVTNIDGADVIIKGGEPATINGIGGNIFVDSGPTSGGLPTGEVNIGTLSTSGVNISASSTSSIKLQQNTLIEGLVRLANTTSSTNIISLTGDHGILALAPQNNAASGNRPRLIMHGFGHPTESLQGLVQLETVSSKPIRLNIGAAGTLAVTTTADGNDRDHILSIGRTSPFATITEIAIIETVTREFAADSPTIPLTIRTGSPQIGASTNKNGAEIILKTSSGVSGGAGGNITFDPGTGGVNGVVRSTGTFETNVLTSFTGDLTINSKQDIKIASASAKEIFIQTDPNTSSGGLMNIYLRTPNTATTNGANRILLATQNRPDVATVAGSVGIAAKRFQVDAPSFFNDDATFGLSTHTTVNTSFLNATGNVTVSGDVDTGGIQRYVYGTGDTGFGGITKKTAETRIFRVKGGDVFSAAVKVDELNLAAGEGVFIKAGLMSTAGIGEPHHLMGSIRFSSGFFNGIEYQDSSAGANAVNANDAIIFDNGSEPTPTDAAGYMLFIDDTNGDLYIKGGSGSTGNTFDTTIEVTFLGDGT